MTQAAKNVWKETGKSRNNHREKMRQRRSHGILLENITNNKYLAVSKI